MKRLWLAKILSCATMACGMAAAMPARAQAPGQERQCWLDAMSDAQKRELVLGYARVKQTEGKARAEAWAEAQRAAYTRQAEAQGVCPGPRAAEAQDAAPADGQRIRNRHGKPCKRIELENRNVPNIGGAMGWALVQVCKD